MFIILLLTWLVLGQFVMRGQALMSFNTIVLNIVGKLCWVSERYHTTCMQLDRVSYVVAVM